MKTTRDNLKEAFAGESQANQKCRAFAGKAKRIYGCAVKAEEVHARHYNLALEAVQRGEDLTEKEFHLCPVCGYIEFGTPRIRVPFAACRAQVSSRCRIGPAPTLFARIDRGLQVPRNSSVRYLRRFDGHCNCRTGLSKEVIR